jgi:hypothetical protein
MFWFFIIGVFFVMLAFGRAFGPAVGALAAAACLLLFYLGCGVFLAAYWLYMRLRHPPPALPPPDWRTDRRLGSVAAVQEAAIRDYAEAFRRR